MDVNFITIHKMKKTKKGDLKIQVLKNPAGFLGLSSSKLADLKIQAPTNLRFLGASIFNKKGDLKIQEMAFMLLGVFLFFILVGLFVLSIAYSNIRDEATRIAEERTLSAVTSISDSPELSCVASKSNCIDGDKLVGMLNKTSYQQFWPFSSLKVIKYSGFGKKGKELITCTFANYPDCDVLVVYDKKVSNERTIGSFIAFCRKEFENGYTYDKCEVGRILAGTELKNAG